MLQLSSNRAYKMRGARGKSRSIIQMDINKVCQSEELSTSEGFESHLFGSNHVELNYSATSTILTVRHKW
jgi:hypothetical protein